MGEQVIKNYSELDSQQKATIADLKLALRKSQEDCIAKTSKLEGTVAQQEKTIHQQNELITNRNPELIEILNKVAQFMEQLTKRMDRSENILNLQTQMLTKGAKRNELIDAHTEDKEGNVLRK